MSDNLHALIWIAMSLMNIVVAIGNLYVARKNKRMAAANTENARRLAELTRETVMRRCAS